MKSIRDVLFLVMNVYVSGQVMEMQNKELVNKIYFECVDSLHLGDIDLISLT